MEGNYMDNKSNTDKMNKLLSVRMSEADYVALCAVAK